MQKCTSNIKRPSGSRSRCTTWGEDPEEEKRRNMQLKNTLRKSAQQFIPYSP